MTGIVLFPIASFLFWCGLRSCGIHVPILPFITVFPLAIWTASWANECEIHCSITEELAKVSRGLSARLSEIENKLKK